MHHSNIIPMYPSTVKSTNIFGRYLIDFPLELRRNHFPVKAFKGEMILTEFGAVNFSAGCQFFFRDSFSCSGFHKPNMKILQGWLLVLKLPVGKEKKKKFNQARLVGKLVIEQPQSAISVSLPPTGNFDSKHQIISKRWVEQLPFTISDSRIRKLFQMGNFESLLSGVSIISKKIFFYKDWYLSLEFFIPWCKVVFFL